MGRAENEREVEARRIEDRPFWQEALAAGLGGYYPPHEPIEYLIRRARGAK